MRHHLSLGLAIAMASLALGCGSETTAPPPTRRAVQLRDIELSNLPSPYYHFEYDPEGQLRVAALASGLSRYDVIYEGGRISALANATPGNRDRLLYSYDASGRVDTIRYADPNGTTFGMVTLTYDGPRLIGLERTRLIESDFIVEKTMTFSYYPDGNLKDVVERHPAIVGHQEETSSTDRFESYDDKLNVDDFSLLHTEFFDHLVLLPGVRLQTGNPGREIFASDGLTYTAEYTYTYDGTGRPLTKSGDVAVTSGSGVGQRVQIRSLFSYY